MGSALVVLGLAAAVVALATGVVSMRRRHASRLALPLATMMLAGGAWASVGALLPVAADAPTKAALVLAVLPLVGVVSTASLWHALVLARRDAALGPRLAWALASVPVAVTVLAATNDFHGLLLTSPRVDDGVFTFRFGPAFYLQGIHSSLLVLGAVAVLVLARRHAVAADRRMYLVAAGALLPPLVGSFVTVARAQTGFTDTTSWLFLVTAGVWLWVERGTTAFRTVPLSTAQVLRSIADAVVVLGTDGRVLEANAAAHAMLATQLVGLRWGDVVPDGARGLVEAGSAGPDRAAHGATGTAALGELVLDVRVTAVEERGQRLASVVVLRDVTELEHLRRELREQAVRDGLTGLHNRRHLADVLPGLVARAASTGTPLTAVMVDIDRFKAVNDRYGHAVGDQVLVQVARQLAGGVRTDDVVVRLGGEEFLLLLPGVLPDEILGRVEAIRSQCASLRFRAADDGLRVTVSAGLAELGPTGDVDAMLRAADEGLYAAKRTGRDRSVIVRGTGEVVTPRAGDRTTPAGR